MSVKTRGQNFKEKQDSYIVSKYPLQKLCINYYGHFNTYTKCFILLLPEKWAQFFYFLVWVGFNDSLVKKRLWKGKNSDFTGEKSCTLSNKWSRLSLPVIIYVGIMCIWEDAVRKTFPLCGILLQDPEPQFNHEKTSAIPKLSDILQNI